MMEEVVRGGPDQGWSWVVAIACCYIHFALFGLFRSCGVLFVALLDTYDIRREEAAWPFGICSAVFSLIGPFAGLMGNYFSVRTISLLGSSIASAGVIMCYFAHNVFWITVFLGVVHGLGFGLVMTFMPVVVSQFFLKHRATATGIAFSGGTMGSLLLPVLLEYLLDTYGLRGTFLLVGGITLNTLVASSLLRPAARQYDQAKIHDDRPVHYSLQNLQHLSKSMDLCIFSAEHSLKSTSSRSFPSLLTRSRCSLPIAENGHVSKLLEKPKEDQSEEEEEKTEVQCLNNVKVLLNVLTHPMFIITNLTILSFFLLLHTFFIVIVDFAMDQGVTENEGIRILTAFSFADLAGRLGSGWITDRGVLKRKTLTLVNMVGIGLLVQLYPLAQSFGTLLTVSICYGLLVGSVVIVLYVLLDEYLGLQVLPVAVGLTYFFTGLLNFIRPSMIGLFRDHIGMYDIMFRVLGGVSVACGMLWLLEPLPLIRQKPIQKEPMAT